MSILLWATPWKSAMANCPEFADELAFQIEAQKMFAELEREQSAQLEEPIPLNVRSERNIPLVRGKRFEVAFLKSGQNETFYQITLTEEFFKYLDPRWAPTLYEGLDQLSSHHGSTFSFEKPKELSEGVVFTLMVPSTGEKAQELMQKIMDGWLIMHLDCEEQIWGSNRDQVTKEDYISIEELDHLLRGPETPRDDGQTE